VIAVTQLVTRKTTHGLCRRNDVASLRDSPRANMSEARKPRLGVADGETARSTFAQRPKREGEEKRRRHTGIVSEAKGQIVVAARLGATKKRRSAISKPTRQASVMIEWGPVFSYLAIVAVASSMRPKRT
jgi:hypothetical protein